MRTEAGLVSGSDPLERSAEPKSATRHRAYILAILAIVAVAIALGSWTVTLLEVEVVPPDIGTCGVVLTNIFLPHADDAGEVSPATCAEAIRPAVREAEDAFWITAGFDAVAIPAILVLAAKRRRLVRAAIAAMGREVTPLRARLRTAPIAWIALATSVAAITLLYLGLQTTGDSIEYAGSPHEPPGAQLAPLFVILAWGAIAAAIALNSIAGTRGLGNRLIGILGGLVLLSPFFAMAVETLLMPLLYP